MAEGANSNFMTGTLFTIGYSGRTIDEFIALLKQYKINALCDVRSTPYSNRNPQFNRELLKNTIRSNNIDYVFLGDELGARPCDHSCFIDGKAVYQKIASTVLFKAGLERISNGVQKGYVLALMCAEKDPLTCHRSILICRNLRGRPIQIIHIIDNSTTETQSELERRLIARLKLYPDLFRPLDTNELIEQAYEIQGDRIAYVEKGGMEQDEKMTEMVSEEHERY